MAEDASELTTVFEAIGPALRRFLIGVARDVHVAEDAMQAAFAKAWEHKPIGSPEELKAWFYKVAFHDALERRRKRARFQAVMHSLRGLKEFVYKHSSAAENAETVERIRREIERLPSEQQLVLRKRLDEDKTFAAIAQEEGMPLGTVLTRMRLALERLRRELGDIR